MPIQVMFQKLGKKPFLYIAIIIVILAIILIWYFSREPEKLVPEEPTKEQIIEQQLKELEKLRAETPPLSEEEVQKQLKELEKLRKETKPLSQEEINKQLEELEKLRKQ